MSWFSLGNSSTEKETRRKTIMSDDSIESINEDFENGKSRIPETKKMAFITSKNDSSAEWKPTKL